MEGKKMPRCWLFTFALCFLSGMPLAVFEIENASGYNFAIADSLLGADNPCGLERRAATADDIFSVADIAAVSIVPSVGNVTSDLSSPKLLWSWFASFPQSATFPIHSDGSCPEGTLELYNPAWKNLHEAKLVYKYGNRTVEANLSGDGPNPVALELDSGHLQGSDYEGLFANLSINLSGKIGVSYSYRKTEYAETCTHTEEFEGCNCEESVEFGIKPYEKEVGSERMFLVETGPVEGIWLSPPLLGRLAGNEKGTVLLLARRMPAMITAVADGREIANAVPYKFEVKNGECGEKIVEQAFEPEVANAIVNASSLTVFPYQLVAKNASYLPYYFEFFWNETAGRKRVVLEFKDRFSHSQNFTREVSVREPAQFSDDGGQGAMNLLHGDWKNTPAAYPSQEKTGTGIDLSSLAILFAIPFALFSIGIIRWLQKFNS